MTENTVFAAVAKAMGEVKRLSKDSRNQEQKYDFASIDDFMAMVGPICAANGLVTLIDETAREYIEKSGKYGPTQWVSIVYQITTFHASGGSLPSVTRHVEVIRSGPQAYGAAQSYVLKQYYRGLLAIPTGDKDDPDHGTVPEVPSHSPQPAPRQTAQDYSWVIAKIEAATTGRDLLAVVKELGKGNDVPAVAEARVERLRALVKGAQSVAALDAMAKSFAPDWPSVDADAANRREELQPAPGNDLDDEIPYQ